MLVVAVSKVPSVWISRLSTTSIGSDDLPPQARAIGHAWVRVVGIDGQDVDSTLLPELAAQSSAPNASWSGCLAEFLRAVVHEDVPMAAWYAGLAGELPLVTGWEDVASELTTQLSAPELELYLFFPGVRRRLVESTEVER